MQWAVPRVAGVTNTPQVNARSHSCRPKLNSPLLAGRLRCPARAVGQFAQQSALRAVRMTRAPATDSTLSTRRISELRKWLLPTLSVALFAAALWIVHTEVAALHLRDVLAEAHRVRTSVLLGAFALTAVSYWLLGFYDVLGLSYIRRRIPYLRTAFVPFIAFAFGHNLSLAALTVPFLELIDGSQKVGISDAREQPADAAQSISSALGYHGGSKGRWSAVSAIALFRRQYKATSRRERNVVCVICIGAHCFLSERQVAAGAIGDKRASAYR
jgi:hypothetical protein